MPSLVHLVINSDLPNLLKRKKQVSTCRVKFKMQKSASAPTKGAQQLILIKKNSPSPSCLVYPYLAKQNEITSVNTLGI